MEGAMAEVLAIMLIVVLMTALALILWQFIRLFEEP